MFLLHCVVLRKTEDGRNKLDFGEQISPLLHPNAGVFFSGVFIMLLFSLNLLFPPLNHSLSWIQDHPFLFSLSLKVLSTVLSGSSLCAAASSSAMLTWPCPSCTLSHHHWEPLLSQQLSRALQCYVGLLISPGGLMFSPQVRQNLFSFSPSPHLKLFFFF